MRPYSFFLGAMLLATSMATSIPTYVFAEPIIAAETLKTTSDIQTEQVSDTTEWVVVLDDPRPARLQGWVRNGYGKSSGDYRGALELKRFAKAVAAQYKLELQDEWFIPSIGVYCLVVRFNEDQEATLSRLKKDKAIQWVQPSNEFELLSSPVIPQTLESDKKNAQKNGINSDKRGDDSSDSSRIEKTGISTKSIAHNHDFDSHADGSGVVIAIIDSAVDASHQDLAGQIQQVGDFVVAGKKQSHGEMHGTAIAGVLIADRDTKLGIAGVAPAADVKAYRGCWEVAETDQTNCNTLSLARALDAVVQSDADILNLSLSGPKDALLDRLLERVIERGAIVVTAFDPARPKDERFPSARDGVLVVRAQNLDKQYSSFFTAPGARVVTSPGNSYDFMHGHSVATAYTSGLLALLKQVTDSSKGNNSNKMDWRSISSSSAAEDLVGYIRKRS